MYMCVCVCVSWRRRDRQRKNERYVFLRDISFIALHEVSYKLTMINDPRKLMWIEERLQENETTK